MKFQNLFFLLLILTITNCKEKNEYIADYIAKRVIVTKTHVQLLPKQKQCLILKEYLKSIPSDDLYKQKDSMWDRLSQTVTNKKEYFRKSFQSFMLLILQQVSNFQEEGTTYLNQEFFQNFVEKLNGSSLVFDEDIKRYIDNPDEFLVIENQKVEFLIKILRFLQSNFVQFYYKHINNEDDRISTMLKNVKSNYSKKIVEIQKDYSNLLDAIKDLQIKKEEIQVKINSFDKTVLNKNIEAFKLSVNFLEKMKTETPNFHDSYSNPIYFDVLDYDLLTKFDISIPYSIKGLFVEASKTLKDKMLLKKIIDSQRLTIDFYEMTKGLRYENIKKIKKKKENSAEYIAYASFISQSKDYTENLIKFDEKEKTYNKLIKDIHDNVKNLVNDKTKILKKLPEVKFGIDYKENLLKELKKRKTKVNNFEDQINKKVIELSQLEMDISILESKFDSEVVIPNSVYLDLEMEVQNTRKMINFNYITTDSEINQNIQENIVKINECKDSSGNVINGKEKEIVELVKNNERYEIMLQVNFMEFGLKILDLKNDCIEILDIQMANILGNLQNMQNNKKCLSLPETSFHIFRMMKTNMIFFEKIFLETFLSHFNLEQQKKFILYNYLMSKNKSYALSEIKELNQNLEYQETFINNFTTNFSILVSLLKNNSTFSNEVSSNNNPGEMFEKIAKSLFSLIKLPLEIYYLTGETVILITIFKQLNAIILAVCPFLNLLPFINVALLEIEFKIYFIFKNMFTTMFSNQLEVMKKVWKEKEDSTTLINEGEIDYYNFDFENILVHPKFFDKEEKECPKWDIDQIKNIEKEYLFIGEDEGFDFSVFDSSDNFFFDDRIQIDVYRLNDKEYLKENKLPIFDIVKGRII